MAFAEVNGVKLFYNLEGQGEPLVLIHGLGLDHNVFDDQVDHFNSSYRVLTYDLRGHGMSDAPETGYSYNHLADDLNELVDHIGLKDIHLVGLSMGGAIAARFVLENPGYARSITFAGSHIVGYMNFKDWPNVFKAAKKEGCDRARELWKGFRLFHSLIKDAVKYQNLTEMVDRFNCNMWTDPNSPYDEPDDLKRLEEINIPALITVGKEDLDFYPIAEILNARLPNKRFEAFDCGHLVSYEKSDVFNKTLQDFLKGI